MRPIYRSCLFLSVAALSIRVLPPVIARSDHPGTGQPSPELPAVLSLPNVPGDEFWDDIFTLEGVSGPVYAIYDQSGLAKCIGGDFHQVGSLAAENIACWNPYAKSWSTFGSGLSGPVHAMTLGADGKLYVGGQFSQAGGELPGPV